MAHNEIMAARIAAVYGIVKAKEEAPLEVKNPETKLRDFHGEGEFDADGLEPKTIVKSEGDRGGHVIGHTKAGRPIYHDPQHLGHANFTVQDHRDAADAHESHRKDAYHKSMELNAKILDLPGHKLFTDEHTALMKKEEGAWDKEKHHKAGRAFHLEQANAKHG